MYRDVVIFLIFSSTICIIKTETSKVSTVGIVPATPNDDIIRLTSDNWDGNPHLKPLWVFRPQSLQPHQMGDDGARNVMIKPPHLLTKLAKPLAFGFDPYFNKDYFEPFERRRKPVTLIAFRKRGIQTSRNMSPNPDRSFEVAELQSSFNEVSSFWNDD